MGKVVAPARAVALRGALTYPCTRSMMTRPAPASTCPSAPHARTPQEQDAGQKDDPNDPEFIAKKEELAAADAARDKEDREAMTTGVCARACVHVCALARVRVRVCVLVRACLCACMRPRARVCACVHLYVRACACACMCACACVMYVCVRMRVHQEYTNAPCPAPRPPVRAEEEKQARQEQADLAYAPDTRADITSPDQEPVPVVQDGQEEQEAREADLEGAA